MKSAGGRAPRTKTSHLGTLLRPKAKARKKQAAQVYAKLFFESRIEPRLTALMKEEEPDSVETPKEYKCRLMKTRSRLIYKMWKEDEHIPEVAEAVTKEKEWLDGELDEQSEDESSRDHDHSVGQNPQKQDIGLSEQQK